MKCKYIYKGHIFNSEAALDDFLIEKHQYESKFGDIVFSKGKPFLRAKDIIENKIMKDAEKLQHKMKIIQARKRGDAFDDEEMLEFEKPFIGVNRFLSGLKTDEGDYIVLDFIVDNYWSKRKEFWTKSLETGEQVADRFTDDEIDIFFEADPLKTYSSKEEEFQAKKEKAHLLNDKECNQLKTLMSKKWGFQAKAGTAVHYVLEQYFSKDSEGKLIGDKSFTEIFDHIKSNIDKDLSESLGDAIYKDFKDSIINDTIINQAIMYAESLKKELRRVHGECEFYPELTISHQLSKQKYGENTNNILGIIDLAVIDEKGQVHYYDYKTSPKEFSKFNSAKKQAFQYQLAMYGKLLKKYGLDCGSCCGKGMREGYHMVSTIQSVKKIPFLNEFDCVITDECFPGNEKVLTEDGLEWISKLVLSKSTKKVWSFNTSTKKMELKPIINWFKKETEFNKFIKLTIGRNKVVSTPNHKYYIYNNGIIEKKEASNIDIGDKIITFANDPTMLETTPIINKFQKSVLIGTVLGDACLANVNNRLSRIRFTHGEKQLEYLKYKQHIFKNLFGQKVAVLDLLLVASII